MMRQEIEIMKNLDHPNIIKLINVFEDSLDLFLVMELCNGGELFDQIEQRGSFSEHDASKVLYQIVQALAYLHRHKIVHLDLKPDKFVIRIDASK
jgi:calcium-dependent protein kinase